MACSSTELASSRKVLASILFDQGNIARAYQREKGKTSELLSSYVSSVCGLPETMHDCMYFEGCSISMQDAGRMLYYTLLYTCTLVCIIFMCACSHAVFIQHLCIRMYICYMYIHTYVMYSCTALYNYIIILWNIYLYNCLLHIICTVI